MRQAFLLGILLVGMGGCALFEQRPLTRAHHQEQVQYSLRDIITIALKNPSPETHEWMVEQMDRTVLGFVHEPEVRENKKGETVTHIELEAISAGRTPFIMEYKPKGKPEAKAEDRFRLQIQVNYY